MNNNGTLSCEVVEDLLPLYHDNVCSEDTRLLVEAHLKTCEHCAGELARLKTELALPKEQLMKKNKKQAEPLKAFASGLEKKKKKTFIVTTVLTVFICTVLAFTYIGLTQWKVVDVPADKLAATNVCRLADGRIAYQLSVKDDKNIFLIHYASIEGSYYITPKRSVIERTRTYQTDAADQYYAVDLARDGTVEGVDITAVYLGPEGSSNLVWEQGMDIPDAPAEVELLFASSD